jgi:hypothetical protein
MASVMEKWLSIMKALIIEVIFALIFIVEEWKSIQVLD